MNVLRVVLYESDVKYTQMRGDVVAPWTGPVATGCRYVLFLDRGPEHNRKHIQEWLKVNLSEDWEEIWPPSLQDYKPLDYFVWALPNFKLIRPSTLPTP